MLLKITNHCTMGCSHCMDDARPDNVHMSFETLEQSMKKINELGVNTLIVSGGEPFDHPESIKFLQYIIDNFNGDKNLITVTSNGLFLEDYRLKKQALKLGVAIQITNDARYYPQGIVKEKHKNLMYEHHIRSLTAQGRARGQEPIMTKAPKCFNSRSIVRNVSTFEEVIRMLEFRIRKFCNPSIQVDGSIVAGESRFCYRIGTVWSMNEQLYNSLRNMKLGDCNDCTMENRLEPLHLNAIRG